MDIVFGGFPCQDISLAGKRAGLDGKRSGLFFRILEIAHDCGAQWIFLENVAAISTASATVVDEAEGELLERAASRVVGELADRGWDAEWITVSAASVGASHKRDRWFCLAWRNVGDAQSQRCGEARENCFPSGDAGTCGAGAKLANSSSAGCQGCQQPKACSCHRRRQETHGPTSQLCRALPIFAPGPDDARWADIIAERPDLAPATQSGVCLLADGLAAMVDELWSHQLRATGNGVVPIAVSAAFVTLARRMKT